MVIIAKGGAGLYLVAESADSAKGKVVNVFRGAVFPEKDIRLQLANWHWEYSGAVSCKRRKFLTALSEYTDKPDNQEARHPDAPRKPVNFIDDEKVAILQDEMDEVLSRLLD